MFSFLVIAATFLNQASMILTEQGFLGSSALQAAQQASMILTEQGFLGSSAPQAAQQAPSTSFSFPSFNSQSCNPTSPLVCMGSVSGGGGVLNLTVSAKNKVGKVMYRFPVTPWPASLKTTFAIRLPSSRAGKMTFIMASNLGVNHESSKDSRNLRRIAMYMDPENYGIEMMQGQDNVQVNLIGGTDITVRIRYTTGNVPWIQIDANYIGVSPAKLLAATLDLSAIAPRSVYLGFIASTENLTETYQLLSWKHNYKRIN